MAYQVNYIDSSGEKRYWFLSIGRLLRSLQSHVVTCNCKGGCSDLPVEPEPKSGEPDIKQKALSWRDSHGYPIVFFDKAGTINAQRHVAALRGLSNLRVFGSVDPNYLSRESGVRSYNVDIDSMELRSCNVEMLTSRPFTI